MKVTFGDSVWEIPGVQGEDVKVDLEYRVDGNICPRCSGYWKEPETHTQVQCDEHLAADVHES